MDEARVRLADLESLAAGQVDCRAAERRRTDLWQIRSCKVELVHDLRGRQLLSIDEGYSSHLLRKLLLVCVLFSGALVEGLVVLSLRHGHRLGRLE